MRQTHVAIIALFTLAACSGKYWETGIRSEATLVAAYCSDARNDHFEDHLKDHRLGIVEAHNLHIYADRVPGSVIFKVVHGSPDVQRDAIDDLLVLLKVAQKKNPHPILALAYHDDCAKYAGHPSEEQREDGIHAMRILEKELEAIAPRFILYHTKMNTERLTDVDVVEPLHAVATTKP